MSADRHAVATTTLRRPVRPVLVIAPVALLTASVFAGLAPLALAETPALQQRIEAGIADAKKSASKAGQPAGAAPGAKVKSQEIKPTSEPSIVLPGLPAPAPGLKPSFAAPLGPATSPVASSTHEKGAAEGDQAYEAFDQGQYLTALAIAQKAAERGDPQAHTLIARIYAEGLGVPQSAETAARWYAKGAELGDIEAAFGLGILYAEGSGVKQDYNEAARLLEVAALKGHPLANYNLGLLFLRGKGKAENPYRAFKHVEYAAERGIVAAQFDLGSFYSTGTGTAHDAWEAARWIRKAANAGHTEAELQYAVILFAGHGTAPDEVQGAKLFRLAAEKGVPLAQNRLGRCYALGKGVEQSAIEAAKWHLIAKTNGLDDDVLGDLYKKLSRADKLKAEKAADEWRDRSQIQTRSE